MTVIKPPLRNIACERAIKLWGKERQLGMVIEECSELQKSVCKYLRYEGSEEWRIKMMEEAADVSIMLEQLVMMVGSDEEFQKARAYKLKRLTKLIDCGIGNQTCENDDNII
jgi:hypothetical protein